MAIVIGGGGRWKLHGSRLLARGGREVENLWGCYV